MINHDGDFQGNEENQVDSLLMSSANDKNQVETPTFPASQHHGRRLRVTLLLAVAYSANVGGTGTLIGSTPQLALKGILEEFCGANTSLTFSSWMAVNVPAMLINTLLIWVWLQFLLNGFKWLETIIDRAQYCRTVQLLFLRTVGGRKKSIKPIN